MRGILTIGKELIGDDVLRFLPLAINKVRKLHDLVTSGRRSVPVTNILISDDGAIIKSSVLSKTHGNVLIIAGLRYLCVGLEVVALTGPRLTRSSNSSKLDFKLKPAADTGTGSSTSMVYYPLPRYHALQVENAANVNGIATVATKLLAPNGDLTAKPNLNYQYVSISNAISQPFSEPDISSCGVSDTGALRYIRTDWLTYQMANTANVTLAVYVSVSVDGGDTVTTPVLIRPPKVANSYGQFMGALRYLGNSTMLAFGGYTTLTGTTPSVAEKFALRTTDAGFTWSEYSLDTFFAWLDALDPNNAGAGRYSTLVSWYDRFVFVLTKAGIMVPLGGNKVALLGYRPTADWAAIVTAWNAQNPKQSPVPTRYTESWVWVSDDNGLTWDAGRYVAESHITIIPLGNGGAAICAKFGTRPYLGLSQDAKTWTFRPLPFEYEGDGEPYNAISDATPYRLGTYPNNAAYTDFYGMQLPRPIVMGVPATLANGLVNLDTVGLMISCWTGVAYVAYTTMDGGQTWVAGATISPFTSSPQDILQPNFRHVIPLTQSGNGAFPNMNENKGNAL